MPTASPGTPERSLRVCGQQDGPSFAPTFARAWRRAQPGQIVGPRHARPQAGAARGSGPAASAANLTGLARDCPGNGRSGRRNRCPDRTKEQPSACSRRLLASSLKGYDLLPSGGQTINVSHTEILTVPQRLGHALQAIRHRDQDVGHATDFQDRKSTRLNSSHSDLSRMPSSA